LHYSDSKFAEDRWNIATYKAFNSFYVTDKLTHSLTHRQTDFIICSMLLTHWAENYTWH